MTESERSTKSSALHPISLGGAYTIEGEIGRGGMAAVYRAHDRRHNRSVAIKLLDRDIVASVGTARFLHEIAIVAGLSHPNIVPVYDSGEQDGILYYVMPHIQGETLRQLIARQRQVALVEVVRIVSRVAAALDFAHKHGVVHRDIKPENVILFETEPLVLDFGIAKALTATDGETLTHGGIAIGTPAYLSPEQASGAATIDGRSDQYSLACVLYEMVTGSPPFTGPSPQGVIAKRFMETPPPLHALAGVPRRFSDAVSRALSLEPDARFPTTGEFARELVRAISESDDQRQRETVTTSLAVLPFANMSSDPDNEFFADGITEDIINALTRVSALRIPSRTASFAFKGKHEDFYEIARRLRVGNILEGSVRKSANRLRVAVQLVNAANGNTIWSDRYDKEIADVFAIQDEIATSIVSALKVVLTGQEIAAIKRVPTRNVRAYEYYLRGRQFYHLRRAEALAAADEMYQQAILLDSEYALAYAGLADSCAARYGLFGSGVEALGRAESAARRALEIDPSLAEAHAAHGSVLSHQRRFEEAEREFRAAIELDPTSYDAAYHYGLMLATAGHAEKAAEVFEVAAELRPEDYQAVWFAMNMYMSAGLLDKARQAGSRAVEAGERALAINPGDSRALSMCATALLQNGEHVKAREWLQRVLGMDRDNPMVLMNAASFESLAGNTEGALDHLARAIQLGFRNIGWLLHDPALANVREHARFNELVKQAEMVSSQPPTRT